LSLWARTTAVRPADIDAALYTERSLVKQLAMRRTLFVMPRDLLPAVLGSASARVAGQEIGRIAKSLVRSGLTDDGAGWLAQACADVHAALTDAVPTGLNSTEVRTAVAHVDVRSHSGGQGAWSGHVPVAPWVLTLLGLQGRAVRGTPTGHWRAPRARWTTMSDWLGESPTACVETAGYAELIDRYLRTFGPATQTDITWWLGATKTAVRAALAALAAEEVDLDDGSIGYVRPGDAETEPDLVEQLDAEPPAALLPVLDPTTMGWKQRDFYLAEPHQSELFDGNGNAGTTAWWRGRAVGCWVQDTAGRVRVVLGEKVERAGQRALAEEAERLSVWLDGITIGTVYPSIAMKAARSR
jgi:hypothetical protein